MVTSHITAENIKKWNTVNMIKKKAVLFSDDNVGNYVISIYDIKYKRIKLLYIFYLNLNRTIDLLKMNQLIISVYRSENCLTTFSSVYH